MSKKMNRQIRLANISLSLEQADSGEELRLQEAAARRLRVPVQRIDVVRKSLDARDKGRPAFVYTLDVTTVSPAEGNPPPAPEELRVRDFHHYQGLRPVVVGAGPAGLFAGLLLALSGLRPIILEQGAPVEQREQDVAAFWQQGTLNPDSNIQFGEGGAGAFSDGKLTSRGKDSRGGLVLRLLAECGAPDQIVYWHKPHIGSDRLPLVVAELRRRIQQAGGEFRYHSRLDSLIVNRGALIGIVVNGEELEADRLILAVGNSPRPLYRELADLGIAMEAKPFAVGLRIRHPQSMIDKAQYGPYAGHRLLGPADYQLTWQDEKQQRGCYTFCNCPGGYIVDASSQNQKLVVNGVSDCARSGEWCNAAVVGQVRPGQDFGSELLDGMFFQEKLEQRAWQLVQGAMPLMSASAFLGGEDTGWQEGGWRCHKVAAADLRQLFPEELCASLGGALQHWQRLLPGFVGEGVLAGVETRTSAPVRILRGAEGMSLNCRGLFPSGEGAGYAGGIVSSAVDGLRAAEALMESLI